jgi:hypothetical protein
MGVVNLIPGRVARGAGPTPGVAIAGGHVLPLALPASLHDGERVEVAVRPEDLAVAPAAVAPEGGGGPGSVLPGPTLPGKVAEVTFLGNLTDCHVVLGDGTRVRVQANARRGLDVGEPVHVRVDPGACIVFPGGP